MLPQSNAWIRRVEQPGAVMDFGAEVGDGGVVFDHEAGDRGRCLVTVQQETSHGTQETTTRRRVVLHVSRRLLDAVPGQRWTWMTDDGRTGTGVVDSVVWPNLPGAPAPARIDMRIS